MSIHAGLNQNSGSRRLSAQRGIFRQLVKSRTGGKDGVFSRQRFRYRSISMSSGTIHGGGINPGENPL
jgi:hypothetical protein